MTYHPWRDLAERYPGVHVELHRIGPARAFWSENVDVIIVNRELDRVGRRCALAHEVAHMDVGDRPTDLCWFATRQEICADKLAARRLIDVDELAATLRWCDDPREIAEALQVTVPVLLLRAAHLHPAELGLIRQTLSRREAVA